MDSRYSFAHSLIKPNKFAESKLILCKKVSKFALLVYADRVNCYGNPVSELKSILYNYTLVIQHNIFNAMCILPVPSKIPCANINAENVSDATLRFFMSCFSCKNTQCCISLVNYTRKSNLAYACGQ